MVELFYEEPVFDGQYSNACYSKRIRESMAHFQVQKKTNLLENWDKLFSLTLCVSRKEE